ncbi:MAG TPA: type II toxin-antitoxin system VapC family toxin [Hyphomicrobiaceae bacterium]|nr:type II toxin-antitoxin system VapC family toxin [Hyphomicrobiaceae bacterium]
MTNDRQLSSEARQAIEGEADGVHVSVATAWEIAIKVGSGKWPEAADLINNFEREVAAEGFRVLPIDIAHVRHAGLLQSSHRDPFDRLLTAQALLEELTLVTADKGLVGLGARCLW